MTINRYSTRADPNQKEIVKGLIAAGYAVSVIKRPLDLLVSWGGTGGNTGKCALIEIKLPGKEKDLTKAQKEFIPTWRGPIGIATTLDEAIAFLESI